MRILVSHESARVQARLRHVVSRLPNTRVVVASNAEDALVRLRAWAPDLVLMSTPMAEGLRSAPGTANEWRDRDGITTDIAESDLLRILGSLSESSDGEASATSEHLTAAQHAVLAAVAAGTTTARIADRTGVPESAIDALLADVFAKLHRRCSDQPTSDQRVKRSHERATAVT